MNLKTTLLLLVLLGAGIGAWFWLDSRRTETAINPSVAFLEEALTADKLSKIEVMRGKEPRFVLEKAGKEWALAGNWPSRPQETAEWIALLTSLRTRFAPISIAGDADLKPFGLNDNPLVIKVTLGDATHTLRFGEEPVDLNRFTRSTYVRVDDKPKVVRLGPGILAALDRPLDYFQQRRLFVVQRVAKDEDSKDKVEQLLAGQVTVETPTEKFTLAKDGQDWTMKNVQRKKDKTWEPVCAKDRVDPDKLKAFLAGFSDLWAEKFVDKKGRDLDEFGLRTPEYALAVSRPNGPTVTLLIGKVSDRKSKMVMKTPPPNPFGQPTPKMPSEVTEEYRYAKLPGNEQIFEIKAEKLRDIAPEAEALRDPQLAHFKPADVTRLEMRHGDQDLVLVKRKDNDQEKWRFKKPGQEDAETKQVEEVLDKLAALRAGGKDLLDTQDLKSVGLEKPQGEIKITLEEGKDDKKKTREITYQLGTKEKEKDKLYVRVDGWPRVNQLDGELLKLVQRPALAYRNRRVLDIAAADLNKIEIRRDGEDFTFEKKDGTWKLAAPAMADVEAGKVNLLANELAKLEGVEFVGDQPKQDELDKTYGLTKSKLTVRLFYADAKKTPQTLTLGNKRDGKQEYYARIDQGPVFTLKKDLHDDLDRTSLSYRPLQIWKLDPEAITDIDVQGAKSAYHLKHEPLGWKITQPFSAAASEPQTDEMANRLAQLKAEKFAAHQTKDLASFGLDKPALTIRLSVKDGKPVTLEVGKLVDKDSTSRFARQAGGDAIFVISEKSYAGLDREALDLLDKTLLSLNPRSIERVRYQGAASFTLEPLKEQWQVVGSPAPAFSADEAALDDTLRAWQNLHAEKYVAYGPKIEWAKYGLEKTATTITVTLKSDEKAKDKKPAEHLLDLGSEANGGRYARLDKQDAVVLLDAKTVQDLARSHLDFVDPRVLKFDLDAVTSIQRQMPGADLTLTKREDNWLLSKPSMRDADNLTVGDLLERTSRLRAKRVAAYPAKDLQPFGLDKPAAVVTLSLENSKHVLKIGGLTKDAARKDTDERYALIDDRPTVVVLSAELSRHLVAPVLYYADRNLASSSGVDYAELTRGPRKVAFNHPEASWQMIAPIKAEAEDAALDDLVRGLQRLRADEIVADKGADLKKYSLDQPILQWRFKSGDAEKLHLLVGAAENDKPGARRYAKLANSDQVFLLNSKITAKLLEEYRNRKPWPALDAVQAEELTVVGPDKTFTLRKKDTAWTVAGEPDWKVKAAVVTDMLDALASLKVQRYLADAKADLQLYGLAKPTWTIEVKTPMGKRTLLLGRHVENSKRFYATVPGSEVVFVLDEADSLRLARPLATFLESEKKK
jgi:hypothetical protein